MLRAKPGILHAELLSVRDGDAYTFNIECEAGVDIRKSLFYTLAEKNWPIIGIEALGMSLEDIFVAIVDQISDRTTPRHERRTRNPRGEGRKLSRAEEEVAKKLTETVNEVKNEPSALFDDDEN